MIPAICYDLLYLLSLSLAAVSFSAVSLFPAVPAPWILPVLVLLSSLYFLGIKHLTLRGRAVLLGSAVAIFPAILIMQPAGQRLAFLTEQIPFFQVILIVLLSFLVGELCRYYRVLRIILSLAGISLLLILLFTGCKTPKLGCCGVFFYLLCTLSDEQQHRSRKDGDTDTRKHLSFISPFLVLMILPFLILKTPDHPYTWDFIRNIAGTFEKGYVWVRDNFLTDMPDPENVKFIGFSGRGEFGGNLNGNDRDVMYLTSRTESDPWIYLAGRSFDHFDGRSWEKTANVFPYDMSFDSIETMSAVLDYKGDLPNTDLMKRTAITIEYTGLNTECMFLPMKYIPGTGQSSDTETVVFDGDRIFTQQNRHHTMYQVVYYRLNRDTDLFSEMLSSGHEVTKENWERALLECGFITGDICTYEEYLSYREQIYNTYLPKTQLSDQAVSYLDNYLNGTSSDYEKLVRIVNLLKDFTYTDQPGDLPEDIASEADYLDYFLFEKQEGYCSYYATAFVLMARYCGIPAAYVQGFHVPMGKYPEATVKSSSAHAWAIAYLDGIGWIPFEPTPGMAHDVAWKTDAETHTEIAEADLPAPSRQGSDTVPSGNSPDGEKRRITIRWYQIVIPVLSGILVAVFLYLIDGILKKNSYRKLSLREKGIRICRDDLKILQRMRAGRTEHETLEEYRIRLTSRTEDVIDEQLLSFCSIFEELLYSKKEIKDTDIKKLEAEHLALKAVSGKHRWKRIVGNLKKGLGNKK